MKSLVFLFVLFFEIGIKKQEELLVLFIFLLELILLNWLKINFELIFSFKGCKAENLGVDFKEVISY